MAAACPSTEEFAQDVEVCGVQGECDHDLEKVEVDVEEDKIGAPLSASEFRRAWWSCFYLNLSVMWAYYTLLSAQDVYIMLFPDANIGFLGIMLTGIAMVSCQAANLIGGFDDYGGFDLRVQGAYVAFTVVALAVMVFQRAGVILAAWAATGVINTMSESKLYSLAAVGDSSGRLTNAVQLGNGSAGLLNVSMVTLIRICLLWTLGGFEDDEVAAIAKDKAVHLEFYLFMSVLICVCLSCIPVYRRLVNMPGFKLRLTAVRSKERNSESISVISNIKRLCRVSRRIWPAALMQFLCFFASLSVFPAIPCSVPLTGSAFTADWYCSPGIIASFNAGDWIGRLVCVFPLVGQVLKGPLRLNLLGLSRLGLVGIILACTLGRSGQVAPALSWIVLLTMIVFAITNGIVATLSMMRAPLLVESQEREAASQIMVLMLYAGIASGTILAAVLNQFGLV